MRYPEIAAQVRKARRRKGWSQERAAREIGTSRIHWIRWEQGLHRPSGHLADRLVEVLGVSRDLFENQEDELGHALTRDLRSYIDSRIARDA